ncbi:MAG: hypothetical protein ABIH48_00150 [Candidatus Falkowbacteria bacterium]
MNKSRGDIVFIAGDGAPGRIMLEVSKKLKDDGLPFSHLLQKNRGAEKLFQDEEEPHLSVSPKNYRNLYQKINKSCKCLVVGHSYPLYQVELKASKIAFELKIPIIKIFDHELSYKNEHFQRWIKLWELAKKPPIVITVIHDNHYREILSLYPQLKPSLKLIGNPLHYNQKESMPQCRKKFRDSLSLGHEDKILSVFLGSKNAKHFLELLTATDKVVEYLANHYHVAVLLDIHYNVLSEWQKHLGDYLKKWQLKGTRVITEIKQDQMIIASDLVLTSPLSTTNERAISYNIPIIQNLTTTTVEQLKEYGLNDPPFTLEGKIKAVLWVNELMSSEDVAKVVSDALNPKLQQKRFLSAKKAGIIPPPKALDKLHDLIKSFVVK